MGVRLLRVPIRNRSRMPHDVGAHRVHRGERGDARHPGQSPLGRPPAPRSFRDDRRGNVARDCRCCCTSARCTTAASANDSTRPRQGINVGYTLSWLRQEENQYARARPTSHPRARTRSWRAWSDTDTGTSPPWATSAICVIRWRRCTASTITPPRFAPPGLKSGVERSGAACLRRRQLRVGEEHLRGPVGRATRGFAHPVGCDQPSSELGAAAYQIHSAGASRGSQGNRHVGDRRQLLHGPRPDMGAR